ncbi:MAG TPA: PSD1 and planctomycete cytochrome C domain-containing protein [Pirellulales bacterium]|nr:PSD1 and planctomycete cytochrome C domain-containing protein [Pirellulales bacterium]
MRVRLRRITLIVALLLVGAVARAEDTARNAGLRLFEEKIHPILAGTCFRCHGDQKVAGGLRVNSRAALLAGGDSGAAIVPGRPEESLLLKAIRRDDDVSAMPPDKELRADQVADVTSWIAAGAPWPEQPVRFETSKHWAFEPVRERDVPAVQNTTWPRNEIDRFLLARMETTGKSPLPRADRRTLIRRLTYDLTGLPPTPEEVAAFELDNRPDAYQLLVDRLLAAPAHGEQWGRHWLDVVRYADTAGENSDHPLPHAWRYRNWVIGAFARDLSYDEFIREQIAGDLLALDGPAEAYADRVTATGYLAIARRFGHDIEKDMHLTLEDTLDTMGKSVLGLSIGCCRCHDHKYDPLTTRDYYGLYGIFASTRFAYPGCEPKQLPRDLVLLVSPAEYERIVQASAEKIPEARAEVKRLTEQQDAQSTRLKASLAASAHMLSAQEIDDGQSADVAQGAQTPLENVAVRRGEVIQLAISPRGNHGADSTGIEFEIIELAGERRRWCVADLLDDLSVSNPHAGRDSDAPTWCFLDAHDAPQFLSESLASIDGHAELRGWRRGDTPSVFANVSHDPVKVWTTLPPRQFFMHPGPQGAVALAWLSPVDGAIAIRGRVSDAHRGGDGVGWQVTHFADAGLADAFAELGATTGQLATAVKQRDALVERDRQIPRAYAVCEGESQNARIQKRGEPKDLGDEVPRKFPDFLGGQHVTQGSGRRDLADWLTNPANPLTARVMVNRLWQWHFGRGLAKTPNDFGTRGAPPTHPELLDYLAQQFVKSGWSVRAIDRLMVTSAAYQQAALGAADDLYVGFARRRLTAEELRDTLLAATGELDRTPGEAHPFPPESSWSFTQHGPFAAEYDTMKRSVYMMQKRNRRARFFALFDGADPNASTPLRDVTTVPTQALFFLNDPFLHERAAKFAARVTATPGNNADRVDFAYRQLFGRLPQDDERAEAIALVSAAPAGSNGWAALSRVLFSSNELLYVD